MSAESLPINPSAFAEAIKELSLPSIYAKASELKNSIVHLQRSNTELQTFVSESCETETEKQELQGYIAENEGVVEAMNARIQLLKTEVENRGQRWIELDETEPKSDEVQEGGQNRESFAAAATTNTTATTTTTTTTTTTNGAGVHRDREDEGEGEEEDGVYL